MMKGIRLAILAFMAFGALAVPAAAFACADSDLPGEPFVEPVGTMRPADEANIVTAGTWPNSPAAMEVAQPQDRDESRTFLRLTRDDQAEASFALAALAPVIFALLTVGLYAAVQRRG